ncbi:unnamed protein product [Leptosia nina]|uniref:Regulation of nuclear pre-mRNA domain-containing protein 2 n=1 Tax=Leptosia nina TaxID=320188 RepID=A0AAV1JEX5_9NEOP
MGETEEFNTLEFEKKLAQLKDTQESIQGLSSWCLKQRPHHKKIVSSWLNVLKRVKVEQRLVLFYLANDVIQYSKRKNYEFVESWGLNLQKATPLVRDEKVRPKILRIFKIWEQRSVYDDEFLSDLTGLLVAGAAKKTDDDLDFQPNQLMNKIKQCSVLEADTDLRLKHIHECGLGLSDPDALSIDLKDRYLKDDVVKELNEGIGCVERYTQALQREIVAREALLVLLTSSNQYYSTQRGEVKVVAYAYKNFGARVRALKRKLDELIPTLPSAVPSPPLRDEDVPSPGPDEDLPLPNIQGEDDVAYNIDQTFNSTVSADGSLYNLGLSSFLSTDNPLSMFGDEIDLTNDVSASASKPQETLPGLDLLTPDSTGNPPPPMSFYSSLDPVTTVSDEPEQHYMPEAIVSSQSWTNAWSVPPATLTPPVPVGSDRAIFDEPPESPPLSLVPPQPVPTVVDTQTTASSALDVDHRGILPPPPPPPVLPMLGHIEDVDHRLLPSMPTLPPVTPPPLRHQVNQDVDHRNLISLTHQLPPRPTNPGTDQDYRVPMMVPPPDIVESVDMDLSEDEEQQGMYPSANQTEHRRNSFNNNKVLVGGDVKRDNIHTNNKPIDGPHSAPVVPPLTNPFDKMPSNFKFTMPSEFPKPQTQNSPYETPPYKSYPEPKTFDSNYDDSPRPPPMFPEPPNNIPKGYPNSPRYEVLPKNIPYDEHYSEDVDIAYEDDPQMRSDIDMYDTKNSDWTPRHRFPRNWTPRNNFRPPGQFGPQFWPRNGPRPHNPRWNGPRRW